jgi:hypothetical protein
VTRALAAIAVALSAAAFAVALAAYQRAGDHTAAGVLSDASIKQLRHEMAHQRLSRDDVRALIGSPASIYRSNPRAECWAYEAPGGGHGTEAPYRLTMCFGPKRHLAWAAFSGPRRLPPPA